jgi:glyoxylase-like metal-dependent hydrolase (beta-lactamase superfamily II)
MSDLAEYGVVLVRADNPSPMTLSGTNTWLVGRDPAWIVDPGPDLPGHVEAVAAAARALGGAGGIALTHDHHDHVEAVDALVARLGGGVGLGPGPLEPFPLPGHAPDHLGYVWGDVVFTGDAVLGEGSVFVAPGPGALSGYLAALAALRERAPRVLCPGHGPVVWDATAKLDEYLTHRAEREERLADALARGLRSDDELLDDVWSDAPATLRPAAWLTLHAHLWKLADEGRLPEGVTPQRVDGLAI